VQHAACMVVYACSSAQNWGKSHRSVDCDAEWQMNKMREWRDAAPGGVVWLGPMKMKSTHPHTYEVPPTSHLPPLVWLGPMKLKNTHPHTNAVPSSPFTHLFFLFSCCILRLFSIVSARPHTYEETSRPFSHLSGCCSRVVCRASHLHFSSSLMCGARRKAG